MRQTGALFCLCALTVAAVNCTRTYVVRPVEIVKLTNTGAEQSSFALADPNENVVVVEDPTAIVLTTTAGRHVQIEMPFTATLATEQVLKVTDHRGERLIWVDQVKRAEVVVFDEKKALLYGFAGAILGAAALVVIR